MTDITRAEVEAVTDELRKEHSEHRNIPGICHEDHEMYPCSTIRLLDRLEATVAENTRLAKALAATTLCQTCWAAYCAALNSTEPTELTCACQPDPKHPGWWYECMEHVDTHKPPKGWVKDEITISLGSLSEAKETWEGLKQVSVCQSAECASCRATEKLRGGGEMGD